jgi:hypothetical protein
LKMLAQWGRFRVIVCWRVGLCISRGCVRTFSEGKYALHIYKWCFNFVFVVIVPSPVSLQISSIGWQNPRVWTYHVNNLDISVIWQWFV